MKSLGDRMKEYENVFRYYLPKRMPCILRLDGRSFHSFTKGFRRPFDEDFSRSMWNAAGLVCGAIDDARLAYVQSDEVSILLIDYESLQYQAWFDRNLQKMVSLAASEMTLAFNHQIRYNMPSGYVKRDAMFDCRAFVLTKEEVCNYFLERQWDATRNSINGVGQAHFSAKQLHGLNTDQVQEKLFQEKDVNWSNLPTWQKRGVCWRREGGQWLFDSDIPKFSTDRKYIEQYVDVGD